MHTVMQFYGNMREDKMTTENKDIGKKYLEDMGAKIGRGAVKFHSMPIFEASYRPYETPMNSYVSTEYSVDISVREKDYERILDIIGYGLSGNSTRQFTGGPDHSYYKDVVDRLDAEKAIRRQHPGIQKAYDKYRTLLSLVANGQQIEE